MPVLRCVVRLPAANARLDVRRNTASGTRLRLQGTPVRALLDGVRGQPAADVAAAAEAASRVSHLAAALGRRLVELDVNPLIVGVAGSGAVAVDARATLQEEGHG